MQVRIPVTLAEKLKKLASKNKRTVPQELALALEKHLAFHSRKTL